MLDSGFTTDGSAFLVMELLEGKGLDTLAGAPPARVLTLIGQALDGLEALAGRGLAHHNLSPDNVFLASGGEQVKLLGLGSALFRPRDPRAPRTRRTPASAPPSWPPEDRRTGGRTSSRSPSTACHALGATVGFGETPVVQLPLAVSFELESDEALRQALERSLRSNPAERPTPRRSARLCGRALGGAVAAGPRPMAVRLRRPGRGRGTAADAASASRADPPIRLRTRGSLAPPPRRHRRSPPRRRRSRCPTSPWTGTGSARQDGELLSAVDDEVLNALLSVPAPPPRPAGPAPRARRNGQGGPVPERSESAGPRRGAPRSRGSPGGLAALLRKPAVVGAIAGVLVLAA